MVNDPAHSLFTLASDTTFLLLLFYIKKHGELTVSASIIINFGENLYSTNRTEPD